MGAVAMAAPLAIAEVEPEMTRMEGKVRMMKPPEVMGLEMVMEKV